MPQLNTRYRACYPRCVLVRPLVDDGVPARHPLGQHMRPLQMPEGGLDVISPQRLVGPFHFLFVRFVHVGAPGLRERDMCSLRRTVGGAGGRRQRHAPNRRNRPCKGPGSCSNGERRRPAQRARFDGRRAPTVRPLGRSARPLPHACRPFVSWDCPGASPAPKVQPSTTSRPRCNPKEPTMNATQQVPCNCTTCPGTGCACGCQQAATQTACACGPQCQCGVQCQCGTQCKCGAGASCAQS